MSNLFYINEKIRCLKYDMENFYDTELLDYLPTTEDSIAPSFKVEKEPILNIKINSITQKKTFTLNKNMLITTIEEPTSNSKNLYSPAFYEERVNIHDNYT
jgi:hypothetical protein